MSSSMGYHKREIKKGVLGEFSKIEEEFDELKDAFEQGNNLLVLCELSDLIGAIELYVHKFNLTIEDIKKFSDSTSEAFKEGKR